MNEKIYVIDGSQQLREMEAQDYDDEDLLQTMLADHPDLLAGHQINEQEPRRWMLVAREMGVPDAEGGANRWSLDHLFLDQDGIPTLVEVKRASDTRIRREVVGQMFDYAANALLHWPLQEIRGSFEDTSQSNDQDPDDVVADLLALPNNEAEEEIEAYWTAVENNLQTGRLRLVFLADRIPIELRRIIEFLNEQMHSTEVLGVELPQFADDELRVITPRVIGQTTAAKKAKAKRMKGIQWDEPSFIKSLQENSGNEDAEVAAAIIDWARSKGLQELWGKGKRRGSITPIYNDSEGISHYLFRMNSSGKLELYFQWYQKHPPFDAVEKRLELMDKLNEIPGVRLTENVITRRPSVPFSIFRDEENLKALQSVFEWYIAQLDAAI